MNDLQNMEEIKKCIGRSIRAKRQSNSMSLEELSELVGITPGYLGLVERGHRGMSVSGLLKLCSVFYCTLDELVMEKPLNVLLAEDEIHISRLLEFIRVSKLQPEETIEFLITVIKAVTKYHKKAGFGICEQ